MKFCTFSGRMLSVIQYTALSLSALGLFLVDWTPVHVGVTALFFYVYSALGVSLVLHRYYAHKAFEFRHPVLRYVFLTVSVLAARGSPLAWVHIHRQHHMNSDGPADPHKPDKLKLFSFKSTYIKQFKVFLIKDLMTKEQIFIHEYYLVLVCIWPILLGLIDTQLLYFAWLLPVCLNQIAQDLWNYYSHVDVGYRNYSTKDNSRNVPGLWPLILGEAWHNNHHANPKDCSTSKRYWEVDPLALLTKVISK